MEGSRDRALARTSVDDRDRAVRELVEIIHDGTEGNPFFVVEVVRLLAAEGQLDRDAGEETIRLRVPGERA